MFWRIPLRLGTPEAARPWVVRAAPLKVLVRAVDQTAVMTGTPPAPVTAKVPVRVATSPFLTMPRQPQLTL
ncbi:hypothetical protein GCM10010468_42550 [Actinocorallia longicatena]|uniref:Uncharacterized protein n=1 Tax=Actinocorallia longicatena TaxID=111803 RepID=A0ABP6QD20_9ACTN